MPIPSTVKRGLYLIASLAILVIGLQLRIQNSQARILHSDEAVQAYQLWELMETGEYRYDPLDKHGPTLYYASNALNRILGIESEDLSHFKLRLGPLIASGLLIAFVLAIGWRRDSAIYLIAAALFALSPLPVVYGAYFIQEALFALLGFLSFYLFHSYWKEPSLLKAAGFGALAAAFFATKEMAVIHLFAIAVATWLSQDRIFDARAWKAATQPKALGISLGVFACVWIVFFSSLFSDFSQLPDSLKAFINYADRSQGQGHEKPFGYYFSIFWPHSTEGVRWSEAPFLLIGFAGLALAAWDRDPARSSLRGAVFYGYIAFAIYCLIPYKTPWLLLSSCLSFAIATGFALRKPLSSNAPFPIRIVAILAIAMLAWQQFQGARKANYYAADSRNPYIYQHTSSQFSKLSQRIEDIEALDPNADLSIAVAGDDNAWPLPWYLRENETVGYWSNPVAAPALDIVVGPVGTLPQNLAATHIVEYHGLRQNVVLECWIRQELWDAFMATRE